MTCGESHYKKQSGRAHHIAPPFSATVPCPHQRTADKYAVSHVTCAVSCVAVKHKALMKAIARDNSGSTRL